MRECLQHEECVNAVKVDGERIVSAGDDGMVKLSDRRTFRVLHSHRLHRMVFSVATDWKQLFVG